MKLPPRSSVRDLDVIVAGVSVVDIIGRPMNLKRPPRPGGMQAIESVTLTTGGNVPNVGIDLAKLGYRVGAISRVGNDNFGGFLRSRMEMHGITTGGLILDGDRQTSATVVSVDGTGERSFFHTRGCMESFRVDDVLDQIDMVRRGRIFAFGYYGLLPECDAHLGRMFRAIRQKTGIPVLLDTAGVPPRDPAALRSFLPALDYFIPSEAEAQAMTGATDPGEMIRLLVEAGAAGVVGVKLGKDGCLISWNGKVRRIPPRKTRKIVDTTGAGDAFIAGFLAGLLEGSSPFDAAKLGNAVASSSLTAVGASTAIQPLASYSIR
jgi:sugar/nucleoside kinase (ribokinase family)